MTVTTCWPASTRRWPRSADRLLATRRLRARDFGSQNPPDLCDNRGSGRRRICVSPRRKGIPGMTAKPKRQAPGTLRAFLNEFLFIRPLFIETSLTPDQCAEQLQSLAHGLRDGFSTTVEIDAAAD